MRSASRSWVAGTAAAGLVAAGAALWFASSWIDRGDSTCGSLWRTDQWRGFCDGTMYFRLLLSAGLASLGLFLMAVAALRPGGRRAISVVAVLTVVAALSTLIVNEFVRSGGLWAN